MVSAAPLALRYPKQNFRSYHVLDQNVLNTEVVGGNVHIKPTQQDALWVAPRQYGNVAKVIFWIAVRFVNASPATARLRVWPSAATGDPSQPDVANIPPGSRMTAGLDFTNSSIINRRFAKAPPFVPLPTSMSAAASVILTQEFDFFDINSQDFFSAWNTAVGDEHLELHAAIEVGSGPAGNGDYKIFHYGMTVVQAPGPQNNTSTHVQMWPPQQTLASGPTVFDRANATTHDQIRGAWQWRYVEADWDNIESIHLLLRYGTGGNNADIEIECQRVDDPQTQAGASTTTLFQEVYDVTNQQYGLIRSQDILPFISDGDIICADWRHTATAIASGGVTGQSDFMLEIVQKDCTKTVTYFHAGPQAIHARDGVPNGLGIPWIYGNAGLIDPQWFANYPDALFSKRRAIGQIVHSGTTTDPTESIYMNSNLLQDQQGSPGTGVTFSTTLLFNANATPTATRGWRYQDKVLSNDPINFAGARKLFQRISDTWAGGASASSWDHPAQTAIYYAFAVPNTEILELGPPFPVGEFAPEGCASTSAGLGDPGVLVITNGSTIPKKFDPVSGKIDDAGVPLPFEGEFPTSIVVNNAAASPEGGIVPGAYAYRYTFRNCCTGKESDPNPDDFTVDSAVAGASPAASHSISFAGVRIPADPQICEICIYRTVKDGQFPVMAKVGCINIDETSVFVDTVPDSELDFLSEGLALLNAPMPCVPVVVDYRNRLFGLGDIPQLAPAGRVSVVKGSNIVIGDGDVSWDRCLEGKFIKVGTDCRTYEIERVLPPASGTSPGIGRLKLVEEYEGETDTGLTYIVCGHQNRLFFSEPLEPECWPNINFLDVEPGDGDKLIGGASNFDALVICKRRKTYILRFRENPLLEVVVPSRVSTDIGCIAPRSFAQVENGTVWLSDRGLAFFDGRGVMHLPASDRFNDILINPDNPLYVRRDGQGRVIDAVGVFYPKREQYLLLLPTVETTRGANLMLVWDTSLNNITLFKFCQEFQSMVVAMDTDGNQRVYMGDVNGFVWMFDVGDNDGAGFPNETGTLRGTVGDAGVDLGVSYLEDLDATFLDGGLPQLAALSGTEGLTPAFGTSPNESGDLGLAGVCVFTRPADAALDDPWVQRTVFAATSTRLYVTPSWGEETPGVGYDYMVAPIDFDIVFKPTNMGTDDSLKRNWKHILTFDPEEVSTQLRVELRPDFALSDDEELTVLNEEGDIGEGRIFDLQYQRGRIRRPVGRRVWNYMQVRMKNFAPDEPARLLNHALLSTPRSQ